MNAERLEKLAAFLDNLPPEKFDFATIMEIEGLPPLEALAAGSHRCGTVGCAIGWCPAAFPDVFEWNGYEVRLIEKTQEDGEEFYKWNFDAACKFFELSPGVADFLFMPGGGFYSNTVYGNATPADVAAHIRRFIKEGIYGQEADI